MQMTKVLRNFSNLSLYFKSSWITFSVFSIYVYTNIGTLELKWKLTLDDCPVLFVESLYKEITISSDFHLLACRILYRGIQKMCYLTTMVAKMNALIILTAPHTSFQPSPFSEFRSIRYIVFPADTHRSKPSFISTLVVFKVTVQIFYFHCTLANTGFNFLWFSSAVIYFLLGLSTIRKLSSTVFLQYL